MLITPIATKLPIFMRIGPHIKKLIFGVHPPINDIQFVLAPVGVPVSVICGQAEGPGTTESCRGAMFRMIGALSTVDPESI